MADDDAFDWVTSYESESTPDLDIEVPPPKISSARDYLKRKIEVRKIGNNTPEYERGYRDGYVDATNKEKAKWYEMGFSAALRQTELPE